MVASHTFGDLRMSWPKMKRALRREFMAPTHTEQLQRQLENTIQGSKSIDEYFKEIKIALQRAGVDDPISMKFHFMMGLHNDISKTIFLENTSPSTTTTLVLSRRNKNS